MSTAVRLASLGTGAEYARADLLSAFEARDFDLRTDDRAASLAVLVFDPALEGVEAALRRELGAAAVPTIGVAAARPAERAGATVWRLLDTGLVDLLCWEEPAAEMGRRLAERFRRWRRIEEVVGSPLVRRNLVGRSASWLASLRNVVEAACFGTMPVLLFGPSGTGKELCARLVHRLDPARQDGEIVTVDCTTLDPALSGSELFGHERGAFTGASGPRRGAVALADRGTLFLDEIGELSLPLQARLLRVLQERRYKSVGGNEWRQSDFRLVSATNRDLRDEVGRGAFRGDLYYRVAGACLTLPALAERREDILPLARFFLGETLGAGEAPPLDPVVEAFLVEREYPGNVRELQQLVRRLALGYAGRGPVTAGAVPRDERPAATAAPAAPLFDAAVARALRRDMGLKEIGQGASDAAVRIVLGEEAGNVARAADRLGVTPRALQMRLAQERARPAIEAPAALAPIMAPPAREPRAGERDRPCRD